MGSYFSGSDCTLAGVVDCADRDPAAEWALTDCVGSPGRPQAVNAALLDSRRGLRQLGRLSPDLSMGLHGAAWDSLSCIRVDHRSAV